MGTRSWKPLKKKQEPSSPCIEDPLLRSETWSREEEDSLRGSSRSTYRDDASVDGGSGSQTLLKGPVICFSDINYEVQASGCGTFCTTAPKKILHNVSGIFKSGMNAILGPTGSGKTTLLDILSGRKRSRDDSGPILIDGRKQPKNFKLIAGYVKQDDILMGTLTVRECLMFSALLRLPSSYSVARKKRRVEDTLIELGLLDCANSKIGTEYLRGISGGERKRTSIGMELIVSPDILFLDEPTTGLDGSTAKAVMSLLHRLSRRGRTIVFSIHQPRFSIFKLFDRLLLVGAGRTMYYGPADEALSFFRGIGYVCEKYNNPPDFFLDVVNGDVESSVIICDNTGRELQIQKTVQNRRRNLTELVMSLSDQYRASWWFRSAHEELNERISSRELFESESQRDSAIPTKFPTSFHHQVECLCKRTVLNLVRNPLLTLTQTVVSLLIALCIGIIYWRLESSSLDGLQNRHGAFFFLAICLCFANLSSLEVFINDLVIFKHESSSGYYRVSAYFLSKVFCDIIPMRILPTGVVAAVTYFMIGLELELTKFLIYNLVLLMSSLAFTSVGYYVGSCVRSFGLANTLLGSIFFFMMFFAGLVINLPSMRNWIRWMKNLSIVHFTVNVLLINEVKNKTFYEDAFALSSNISGSDYLKDQGIDYETPWDLWKNILALGVMSLICLFATFLRLLRIGHLKLD